jgi:hypothetical protein
MPNDRWRHDMRKLFLYCLFSITVLANPLLAEVPVAADAPSQHISISVLQARFAKLQQVARPDKVPFELQLVGEGQAFLGQFNDGIVRVPEDWVLAAPDQDTLDFLMLLGLSNATLSEPTLKGPSTATKIVTGTLGWIAKAEEARRTRRTWNPWSTPHFETSATSGEPGPALRALTWTTATGGCEARIVAGLHKLKAINGPIGRDARQILKALGAVAWTPNDRCGPPAS